MSVQDAIVFGFENKSWLGNQHGKHTSNIQKHFLCLATGKNLGCFFSGSMSCCSGHWNNVVATKDKWKKKKKNLLHLSSSTSFAWKPLCGDLCDWAGCLPVTGQGKDGQGGPSASQSWFPPHPTLQLGTFSISSSGKAGNWLFLWDEHDPEKHSAQSACVLDRVLGAPSHQRGFEPLSTADMQVFQGNSNSSWAPNHHNSWPSCLHRQSEKFISTGSS